MMNYISLLYNFILFPVIYFFAKVYKLINKKFKLRENKVFPLLKELSQLSKKQKRIWFHCSSMGEFEQAKPIIEYLKVNYECEVICSFFSASGYENQKSYKYADFLLYLPLDTPTNAKKFIDIVQPDLAIFIRYDIWHNYLAILHLNSIPIYLANATKPVSKLWRLPILSKILIQNYDYFDKIFCVGNPNKQWFSELNISSVLILSTDTRYDRIFKKVESSKIRYKKLKKKFKKNVIVAGSIWKEDLELFKESNLNDWQIIFVPHEPEKDFLNDIKDSFNDVVFLSDLEDNFELDFEHLAVDSIGKLLSIYALADLAYVGGGFGRGLHSVSEPAGFSIPIITGPNILSSIDAGQLKNSDALYSVDNSRQFNDLIEILSDKKRRLKIGQNAQNYLESRLGASIVIGEQIKEAINL